MSTRLVPLIAGQAPTIALERQIVLIGRHLECDARLDRPEISRRHCCIAHVGNELIIRDLGSHNGTRINGHRVEESILVPGDEVAIGPVLFRYDTESSPDLAVERSVQGLKPNPTAPSQDLPVALDDEIDLVPLDD